MVQPLGVATERLNLSSGDWRLLYSTDPSAVPATLPEARALGYSEIPASVPGSVELDLQAAGLLPDLYVGANIRQAWRLEYGDWWYVSTFEAPVDWAGDETSLLCHGLDTVATLFLNGVEIGTARNMMVEHEFQLGSALRPGANELAIHLASPLLEAERQDYPSGLLQVEGAFEALWVRKPGHMFGWDIAPRLVSAGVHREIELVRRPRLRLEEFALDTLRIADDRSEATVELHYVLTESPRERDLVVRLVGSHHSGHSFEAETRPHFRAGKVHLQVEHPRLWCPRGYGAPELYNVTIELLDGSAVIDRHELAWGIRRIEVNHDARPMPDGQFQIRANGEPFLAMGTNWVPLDAIHARDAERLDLALDLLWESGSNMVRCWGGNLYEDTAFFEFCDRHGLLVWQDFAFACARYPQSESFLGNVADEAASVIRKLRNHPSLALWCGSNEDDDTFVAEGLDPNVDRVTREVLPRLIYLHDRHRAYIVGSPSYTPAMVGRGASAPPEQHLWGVRAAFKAPFYSETSAAFVSEVGFHGCPEVSSLERFLEPGHRELDPADDQWVLHETLNRPRGGERDYSRIQLMRDQVSLFFGPDELALADLVFASQVSQAEAKKYFVESTRLGKPRRTGVIWWNLLDCWPQISDAVVDYYGVRKLAFEYLRRAQRPVTLACGEVDGWHRGLWIVNDSSWSGSVHYEVTDAMSGETLASGNAQSTAGQNVLAERLPIALERSRCLLLRSSSDQGESFNHYLEGVAPFDLPTYRDYLVAIRTQEPDRAWPRI